MPQALERIIGGNGTFHYNAGSTMKGGAARLHLRSKLGAVAIFHKMDADGIVVGNY